MKPFATVAILTLTLSAGCTSETTDVADTDTSTTQTATPEMVDRVVQLVGEAIA